jgi:acyl-CoA reductase-like NAD-dependent aldehyde dehydrogenase
MATALEAFATWRHDEASRRGALVEAEQVLTAALDEFAGLITLEQGKPLREARLEVRLAAKMLEYHAGVDIPRDTIQHDSFARVEVVRRPLGVVAAITPWNFPVLAAVTKMAPAVLCGNTVVLKPSPFTPLSTLRLGELLGEIFPPGVFNVISGDDNLGSLMTHHPIPRKITFTGSVATGKLIAAAAAIDLKRVTLELGGNDAAIILDDADAAAIAPKIFGAGFANCGQVCAGIKRVYAPRNLYDDIVEALGAIARSRVVGNGIEKTTQMGPLSNGRQRDRITELVGDATRHGARIVAGGSHIEGSGYFFEPTVLADVGDGVRVVDEEQFGPALPVIKYDSVEEAIERANNTTFGLAGSVWTSDESRGLAVANQLECGTVWINSHLITAPHQPFAGMKSSGIGVESGPWGLLDLSDLQVLHANVAS